MADHIERIILQADESSAVESVDNANAALEQYEETGATANKNVGKSFEVVEGGARRSADQIERHNRQLDVTEKRLIVVQRAVIDRTRAEDRLLATQKASADAHERTAAAEAKLAVVRQASADATHALWKATVEVVGTASAAAAAYGSHASAIGGVANSLRAARIAWAGWQSAITGSATALEFAGLTIGVGLFVETLVKANYHAAKLAEGQAIAAEKAKLSVEEYERLAIASELAGKKTEYFSGAVKDLNEHMQEERGRVALRDLGISATDAFDRLRPGSEVLADIARKFDGIRNPGERARLALALFGDEGTKYLDQLNSRFADNQQKAIEWGATLSSETRQQLAEFKADVDALANGLDVLGDDFSLVGRKITVDFVASLAGGFDEMEKFNKSLHDSEVGKLLRGELRTAGQRAKSVLETLGTFANPQSLIPGNDPAQQFRDYVLAAKEAELADRSRAEATSAASKAIVGQADSLIRAKQDSKSFYESQRDAAKERARDLQKEIELDEKRRAAIRDGGNRTGVPFKVPMEPGKLLLVAQEYVAASQKADLYAAKVKAITDKEEAEKAAAEKVTSAEKRAHELLIEAQKGEFAGLARIIDEYTIYRRELGLSADANRDLASAAKVRLQAEAQKELKKNATEAVKGIEEDLQADLQFRQKKFQNAQQYDKETLELELKTLDDRYSYESTVAQQSRDSLLRSLDAMNAQTVNQKIAVEAAKFTVEKEYFVKSRDIQIAELEHRRDREIAELRGVADVRIAIENGILQIAHDAESRLAAVEIRRRALSGAVGPLSIQQDLDVQQRISAATTDIDIRYENQKNAAKEQIEGAFQKRQLAIIGSAEEQARQITLKSIADTETARQQAITRSTEIMRESYQRTFDSIQRSAQSLLDGFLTHSRSVGDAIKGVLKAAFLTPIENGVSNQIAAKLTGLITGQKVTLETQQVEGTGAVAGIRRAFAALGVGAQARFSKLESPNHLGDVNLVAGAVPVYMTNAGQQQGTQHIVQQVTGGGGLGTALGLGLATLSGAFGKVASAVGGAAGIPAGATDVAIRATDGRLIGAGSQVFSGADRTNPLIMHALGSSTAGSSSAGGGSGILSTLAGFGGGLKSFLGFGENSVPLVGGGASTGTAILQSGSIGQKLTALGRSNAALLGGGVLAYDGLRRGGVGGLLETTGGGALIGFKYGGPIGALIGAGVGAIAGTIRLFIKSPEEKVQEKVKAIWGYSIDKATAKQIVAIGQQRYGGNLDMAVRAPETRELLSLWAQTYGQKDRFVDERIHSASLIESRGKLYQGAVYDNGTAYGYSSNLPTYGGVQAQPLSTGSPQSGSSGPVIVQVSPQATVDLWRTGTAQAIQGDPRGVAQSALQGNQASSSRYGTAVNTLSPSVITQ
jgi:hypothetical protein